MPKLGEIAAEIEQGSALPFKLSWESGPAGHIYGRLTQATQRILRDGDLIINEIEGPDTPIPVGRTVKRVTGGQMPAGAH